MTHRLISIHQVADRLGVPVRSVRAYMRKGWLAADVPGDGGYFDASKVERLRKRLPKLEKKARRNWLILGAVAGAATTLWLMRRPKPRPAEWQDSF
jgi:hypothetical protein